MYLSVRHLPCVEEIDPGLALLDLEQRVVVGGQARLELLDHLDLERNKHLLQIAVGGRRLPQKHRDELMMMQSLWINTAPT